MALVGLVGYIEEDNGLGDSSRATTLTAHGGGFCPATHPTPLLLMGRNDQQEHRVPPSHPSEGAGLGAVPVYVGAREAAAHIPHLAWGDEQSAPLGASPSQAWCTPLAPSLLRHSAGGGSSS